MPRPAWPAPPTAATISSTRSPSRRTGPVASKTPVSRRSAPVTIHAARSRTSIACVPPVGGLRSQDVAALGQPLGPVGEAAAGVAGSDDEAGAHDQPLLRASLHLLLAGDLARPVGVRAVLLDVLGDRVQQGQRVLAAAGRRVVGVHADRGDERPVRDAIGQDVEGAGDPRGRARDVDDGVPLTLEGGPVRSLPVEHHVARAGGHGARPPARSARDVVTTGDRVGGDRVGEELGAAENQKSHPLNLSPGCRRRKSCSPRAQFL